MGLKTFEEFLNLTETPDGERGEWEAPNMAYVGFQIKNLEWLSKYELIGTQNNFNFYVKKTPTDKAIVVDMNKLIIVLELKISSFDLVDNIAGKQTNMVKILEQYADNKLAKKLYSLLLENGYVLVSDYTQYDGARALWKSLGRMEHLYSYIFDEVKETLTQYKNFDGDESRFWGFDGDISKRHILLCLSKKQLKVK